MPEVDASFAHSTLTTLLPFIGICALIIYSVGLGIYRIWFSPIAHIPGPLLGRLTTWVEFYYDVILRGQYVFRVQELHKQYGPIIRISPEEVHILDPEFYDEIYAGPSRKRDKWSFFCNAHGVPQSSFATVKHETHRMRRAALNPFFSKQKVRSLQPRIENVVNNLLVRFDGFANKLDPVKVSDAFAALTYDVAHQYAFGSEENRVNAPDFAPGFRNASQKGGNMAHLTKKFPWLHSIMNALPEHVMAKIDPDMAALVRVHMDVEDQMEILKRSRAQVSDTKKDPDRLTIFEEILDSNLPESEKSTPRLWQEGYVTITAGTLTTADALTYAVYGLLAQPDTLRQLRDELFEAIPDASTIPPIATIENLQYLTACIEESLRLSNGVSTRLQRIDPEKPLIYTDTTKSEKGKQYIIPAGTPCAMTSMLIHFDGKIYPDPKAFKPERWLNGGSEKLRKCFVPFTRGTRQCLGMQLAYAELYLTLAMMFRRYGGKEVRMKGDEGWLELYDFDFARDLEIVGDGMLPLYTKETRGVRVVVKK